MRKLLLILFITLMAGLWWRPTDAQLNKAYFFYVGRNFLIENKYLSTSKGRNNYNIKVGDKTVSTYAFPCDKLELQ